MSPEESQPGPVAAELRAELPGLQLRHLTVGRGSGRSSTGLRQRLRLLSDRFGGAQAIALRSKPIPAAYRVFYRHIGLDPDEQRPAAEQLALERMLKGRFESRNLLDDALTVAIVESGVPVRAFDADRLAGPPGIRPSTVGEGLEGRPGELPTGTLLVADPARPLALLFGAVAAGRGVAAATSRITLVAIGVAGVPDIAIEEALWLAADAIETA